MAVDHPVALQMDYSTLCWDLQIPHRHTSAPIDVDEPFAIRHCQPPPPMAPQQLKVADAEYQLSKRAQPGLKPRSSASTSIYLKHSFLVDPPLGLS